MSACLPQSAYDLRHDRAVADGKREGTSPQFRISAWLPPGLALGWLAALATFVHSTGNLLTAWAATVSLAVLLARRRSASPDSPPEITNTPAEPPGPASSAPASLAAPPAPAARPGSAHGPTPDGPVSGTASEAGQLGPAELAVIPGLQVLTAAEVASVLRVDTDVIILAIRNGELPGNRVGGHWRVDASALVRWLQGAHGHLAREPRA
jgi:excisionase family DNA binding protein